MLDTHSPSSHRTSVPFPAFMRPDPYLPAHDPAAVDFRAFYPYTPNEVKHRKRTTSSQLKILEDIFKRDTKPNAHLRNDLAAQLDMTPRGVQVWFQNRRAKEKNKASKVTLSRTHSSGNAARAGKGDDDEDDDDDDDDLCVASPVVKDEATSADEPLAEGSGTSRSADSPPAIPSPPQLHVITDPVRRSPAWQDSPIDPLSDSAAFLARPVPFSTNDLFLQRRGSLPINALFSPDTDTESDPAVLDSFDPLARRRSVDASLQRLANNPYAHLARAKNGALFGPRFGVTPPGRHRSSLGRMPYAHNHHHHYPRPTLSHHAATLPQYSFDMRRSSMDSRGLRFSARGTASPSPSPLSPYHAIRASLPDQSLYAITSRTVVSPIPGPLPSPHFSFGDASTPSMTSPSSGDSDRNSPDSIRSFPFRGDDRDEDDRTSASYDAFSRFGSIASIATSDSSINSAYYSEIGGPGVEHDLSVDLHAGRRDSCTSGPFLGMMSGLDVTGPHPSLTMGDGAMLSNSLGLAAYPSHLDDFPHLRTDGIQVIDHSEPRHESSAASYPSPASTISPGSVNGSPHEGSSAAGTNSNTPEGNNASSPSSSPSNMPISSSSELAFALHSKPDQEQQQLAAQAQPPPQQAAADATQEHQHLTYQSVGTSGEVPEQDAYYYAAGGMGGTGAYGEAYSASAVDADAGGILNAQGHFVSPYEGYGTGDFHHGHQQHQQHLLDFGQCTPSGIVANAYAVPYTDSGINPSMVSGMDAGVNHSGSSPENFVRYS